MDVFLREIAYALPRTTLSNDQLRQENPLWDMDRLQARTGVVCRQIAEPEETALDLAVEACRAMFAAHPELPSVVDAVLFCTETPDYLIPPNSCVLHGKLGLAEHVLAFDLDLGCSGYPYALGLARGLLLSAMAKNVLVVNADTYSKLIDPKDQSVRVLFGDGAAVSWLTTSGGRARLLDVRYGTDGRHYDKFIVPVGGARQPCPCAAGTPRQGADPDAPRRIAIQMDGMAILGFVNTKIPSHVQKFLGDQGLGVNDVDLFVFHQASQMVLDSLTRLLRIRPERVYANLSRVGNLVSASIPVALKDALDAGRLAAGHRVLLCGFGLGLSWGSTLLEWL